MKLRHNHKSEEGDLVQGKTFQKRERRCWKPPKLTEKQPEPKVCVAKKKGFTKTTKGEEANFGWKP